MNWIGSGAVPDVGLAVNAATGIGFTVIVLVTGVLLHDELPAIRDTVKVPADEYVFTGFFVVAVFPSPKAQYHLLGAFVEESVNCTVNGWHPVTGFAVKLATGTTLTVIVLVKGVLLQEELPAIREAV